MEQRVTYEFSKQEMGLILDGLELLEEKYKHWVDNNTSSEAQELRWTLEEGLGY